MQHWAPQVSPHMPIQRMAAALLAPLLGGFGELPPDVRARLAWLVVGGERKGSARRRREVDWHLVTFNILKLQVWQAQVRLASPVLCPTSGGAVNLNPHSETQAWGSAPAGSGLSAAPSCANARACGAARCTRA